MEVARPADARSFLELAGPLLERSEARNNLILGIAGTLVTQPELYPESRLWVVIEGGLALAAALRTPPHNLVVGDPIDITALKPLLRAVHEDETAIPGMVVNDSFAEPTAGIWTSLTGTIVSLWFGQGVFSLSDVVEVPQASGSPREATDADRDLAISWMAAFLAEAVGHRPVHEGELERAVDSRLRGESAGLWFWELDGTAVSMSGFGGPTPTGIRIGPVYTPAERRRHGYATSLVAEQSAALLDRGFRACFLFTDMSNRTSNAIYERIGYRKVAEAFELRFSDADR